MGNQQHIRPAGLTDEQLGQSLGLRAAPRSPQPQELLWYAVAGAATTPPYTPPSGPSLTVTLPPEAKAFLADLKAKRDHAYEENAAQYRRSQNERGAWERKVEANGRVTQRYSVDVDAIENRTALAAAQAVEDTYRAIIDELRGLYPSD